MSSAPRIESPRLILTGHQLSDFEESAAMWADPAVTRFIGGRASTREESWARLLRNVGHWSLMGFGYFVARHKESGRFAGEMGLARMQRELAPFDGPPFGDAPECGWALASDCHGRGLATEAVRAVLAWADAERLGRTVCMMDPGNAPSRRVAEKCGYRQYATTTYKGEPTVLFERIP